MRIELVSIGDELLKGRIVNTNVSFLSSQLHQAGYSVMRHVTLSDARESLKQGLAEALDRAEVVLCTGGLGPTLDDATREVAATLFEMPLYRDQELEQELRRRYPFHYDAVQDQSLVPRGAELLANAVGSAPGLILSKPGKTLILLPGVPQEMKPLFSEGVLPWLQKRWPQESVHSVLLHFCLLYESAVDPHLRRLQNDYPQVHVGIYPSYGKLVIALASLDQAALDAFEGTLKSLFASYYYSVPSGTIEEALFLCCKERGYTVACAESCTGGQLAAILTSVPGVSECFLGSLVTYSNGLKKSLLHVSDQTLQESGAVSKETVAQMLEGVWAQTDADWGIAVSGLAGPAGGSPQKPVGTVWAAIGRRGETPDVGKFHVPGDRDKVRMLTAYWLIGALWRKIEKGVPAFPFIP